MQIGWGCPKEEDSKMPLYDYKCEECGEEFEGFRTIKNRYKIICKKCGGGVEILIGKMREPIMFVEGVYDIGQTEQRLSSRRQLKDAMNRHNDTHDEFRQSYAKYLDGYGY
jgi:putative FmdB family regulatory protein